MKCMSKILLIFTMGVLVLFAINASAVDSKVLDETEKLFNDFDSFVKQVKAADDKATADKASDAQYHRYLDDNLILKANDIIKKCDELQPKASQEQKSYISKVRTSVTQIRDEILEFKSTASTKTNVSLKSKEDPTRANEDDLFIKGVKAHGMINAEYERTKSNFVQGRLNRNLAMEIWKNRFIPENKKIIGYAPNTLETHKAFRKALTTFDQLLESDILVMKEGASNKENLSENRRLYAAYEKAAGDTKDALNKEIADIKNMQTMVSKAKNQTAKPQIKQEKPVLNLSNSGESPASSCRSSLNRYPKVAPAMMTMCRNANRYSAQVMDAYTSIYRGGMSKGLMDVILQINSQERATCANQVANKFRGSMTAKYLMETCF